MKPIIGVLSVLTLSLSISASESQDKTSTPAKQYTALLREYRPVSGRMRKATTDQQRKAAVERLAVYPAKFVELAEKNPQDPIVLTALKQAIQAVGSTDSAAQIAWETNRSDFPAGVTDDSAGRIVTLLLRDHVKSDKLGPVLDRIRYGYRMEFEKFMSTVLQENPHRNIQGEACLYLAQFLNDRLRLVRLAADRPELAECCEIVFGKNYLPVLQRLGQARLATRIETLFERAAKEYGDVKIRGGTVGERAKSELYDIRHLGIGKVAPDIEGQDQDGGQFKLSDSRGKVVLLYFWSEF